MQKFETLKDDISKSSEQFSNFQMDSDTRKAEITTLETHIQNMQHIVQKKREF